MAEKTEQYGRLVYRLTDLADRYHYVGQDYFKELHDYGTGELYTSTEVHMVTRIQENPGITASKIAEATGRTKSAVSQMLSKLEAKGLIYREKDPCNGKQHFLYTTPKGHQLSICHEAYDMARMPLEEMIVLFGVETLEKFSDVMEYMIHFYQTRRQ